MAIWIYDEQDFSEKSYELIPEGVYRVRIDKTEETVTRSTNKNMIKLTLSVSGYDSKLWSYVVLDDSNRETIKKTNQTLGTVFSSFGISDHTMNTSDWEGKVGGVRVRHKKDAQGINRAEVAYFLYAKEVEQLPPWQEGKQGTINPDMVNLSEEKIPF